MRPRLARRSLLPLALALSSSLAFAQPPAPPAPQAAPIERQPPSEGPGRPGMMHGGPTNFRGAGMMHGRGRGPVGGFHGGPGAGFRGAQDGLGAGFHIAPLGMWWKNPAIVQRLTLTAD